MPKNTEFCTVLSGGQWTFMSEDEITECHRNNTDDGHEELVDLAVTYLGMGHVRVLSYDVRSKMVSEGIDGGACGHSRGDNRRLRLVNAGENECTFYEWRSRLLG